MTQFAIKHFGLSPDVRVINADAIKYVHKQASIGSKYDLVVHDVFTGGAEPVDLFSIQFLTELRSLLSDQGMAVINYAGDTGMHSTKQMVTIIASIFLRCKVFRDNPAIKGLDFDLASLVVFCSASDEAWSFAPWESLESSQDSAIPVPDLIPANMAVEPVRNEEELSLLWQDYLDVSLQVRRENAKRHWLLMRQAFPSAVWDNW